MRMEPFTLRIPYQREHATNPCNQCGAAPGVVCEHDELELLELIDKSLDTREPAPKIAKGEG